MVGEKILKEFRCTRPDLYDEGTDNGVMQGHYVIAEDEWEARMIMHKRFPDDRQCTVKFFRTAPLQG